MPRPLRRLEGIQNAENDRRGGDGNTRGEACYAVGAENKGRLRRGYKSELVRPLVDRGASLVLFPLFRLRFSRSTPTGALDDEALEAPFVIRHSPFDWPFRSAARFRFRRWIFDVLCRPVVSRRLRVPQYSQ